MTLTRFDADSDEQTMPSIAPYMDEENQTRPLPITRDQALAYAREHASLGHHEASGSWLLVAGEL